MTRELHQRLYLLVKRALLPAETGPADGEIPSPCAAAASNLLTVSHTRQAIAGRGVHLHLIDTRNPYIDKMAGKQYIFELNNEMAQTQPLAAGSTSANWQFPTVQVQAGESIRCEEGVGPAFLLWPNAELGPHSSTGRRGSGLWRASSAVHTLSSSSATLPWRTCRPYLQVRLRTFWKQPRRASWFKDGRAGC